MRVLTLTVALLPACSSDADTCTAGYAYQLDAPAVLGDFQPAASGVSLTIGWSRDTAVPDDYYAVVALAPETPVDVMPLVNGIAFEMPDRFVVGLNDLTSYLSNHSSLDLTLELPDPRDYALCHHRGMADRHLLNVILGVDSMAHVTSTSISQEVVLGAI